MNSAWFNFNHAFLINKNKVSISNLILTKIKTLDATSCSLLHFKRMTMSFQFHFSLQLPIFFQIHLLTFNQPKSIWNYNFVLVYFKNNNNNGLLYFWNCFCLSFDIFDSTSMAQTAIAIYVATTFFISLLLVNRYANWKKISIVLTIAVFLAWSFALLGIAVLPVDISNVSQNFATFYN